MTKNLPKDGQVMVAILRDMGVTDYEPRVVNQMLEFAYRYVTDVLDDAKAYSNHAIFGKRTIDVDDVRLAVQCKLDHSYTTPPPRDLLMDVARHKNSQVLPLIKKFSGPQLPPDRHCLTATNYRMKTLKKNIRSHSQGSGHHFGQKTSLLGNKPPGKSNMHTQLSLVSKGGQRPTVTVIPKVATPPISIPRPAIQITPGLVKSSGSNITYKRKREDDDYDIP